MFYDVVLEHSFLTELLIDRRPGPVDAEGRSALRRLRGFARVFTIAQPAARIWQGAAAFSAGKLQEASRSWEQGARAASALKMPYFEAIARRQLQRAS